MFRNGGNWIRRRRELKAPVVVMRPIGNGQFVKTLSYPVSPSVAFALPVRTALVGYLNASYDLLAYSEQTGYVDASYDLLAYTEAVGYVNGSYDLNCYAEQTGYLDASYDLLAYSRKVGYLDATYDLQAYQQKTGYIDVSYDLLAYTPSIGYLDASYDFNAYTAATGYLDATYDFLANEVFYGYAINLNTFAVSKFENYGFNSLSNSLGADSTGIHTLSGATDNGTAINAFIETGRLDFGDHYLKRIPDAWLGVKGGKLKLTVTDETTGANPYTIAATTQMKTSKANLGRGCKGKYWKFKLENVAGSSAVVDDLVLNVEKLTRKI